MFAKTIVLSDAFLDMPLSARCLYFTLGMFADDEGFVNSPKGIMRQAGCSDDDMKVLLAKKFLLAFDSGVIVIKHWRINNYLRNDRYVPTKYIDEKAMLSEDENNAYTLSKTVGIPSNGIPSIGKDSIGKDRLDSSKHPTLDEVKAYCNERNNRVDPERFIDYYTANGWKVGKNPMKDWKAAVRTWERQDTQKARTRNTLLNYDEKGRSHASVEEIELDLEEL
jgi:hypothetical protein